LARIAAGRTIVIVKNLTTIAHQTSVENSAVTEGTISRWTRHTWP